MKCPAVICSFLLALILIFSGTARGAEAETPKPLTNDNIVTMVQAGLPQDVIVEKIKASKTAFDTSTEALVALKKAGVGGDVIRIMVNPAAEASPTGSPPLMNTNAPAPPANQQVPSPVHDSVPAEKDSAASTRTQMQVTFSGGDGSSCTQAIVINGASTERLGLAAEDRWIRVHFPAYHKVRQQLLECGDNRRVDLLSLEDQAGAKTAVYFDIADFFGKGADASVNGLANEAAAKLAEAHAALKKRDFRGAIDAFRKANKLAGGRSADCLLGLAMAYNQLGAAADAADAARQAASATEDGEIKALAYNQVGLALLHLAEGKGSEAAEIKEAERAFVKALEVSDDGFELARFNLGRTLLRESHDAEGLAEPCRSTWTASPTERAPPRLEHFLKSRAERARSLRQTTPSSPWKATIYHLPTSRER